MYGVHKRHKGLQLFLDVCAVEASKLHKKEADSAIGTQIFLTIYDLCQNIVA